MQVPENYRSDYDGEFVITSTVYSQGKKKQTREWIDNPIDNKHASNRAVCIANGITTHGFLLHSLEHHTGGLLASQRLQSYGVQEMHTRMVCDFTIVKDTNLLNDIIQSGYYRDNIVYTSASQCITNPGMFYLIPHGIRLLPHATAVWLACFDGHKEVFLFGYDACTENGIVLDKMISGVNDVMQAYPSVKFYHVIKAGDTPTLWKYLPNIRTLTLPEFVSYTDT